MACLEIENLFPTNALLGCLIVFIICKIFLIKNTLILL